MAYYPTRSQVERNTGLLKQIQAAIIAGDELVISPAKNQSPGGAKYWIRNVFASADVFKDLGFAGLGAATIVSIMDDGRLRLYPSGLPSAASPSIDELDEMAVLAEAMTGRPHSSILFTPSEDYDEPGLMDAVMDFGYDIQLTVLGDGMIKAELTKSEGVEDVEPSSPFDIL